jgi:cation diffusion facilitator family transporter
MTDCCEDKSCEVAALRQNHARILKTVLAINAVMFVVEITAGTLARSTALTADSLDMLGDALAYGLSLYVLGKGARLNAFAALFKGGLMTALGLMVLGQALFRAFNPSLPVPETVGAVGLLALTANLVCLALLWKSRGDDLNMRSVWLCSRNDILVNLGVLVSAAAVHFTQSRWPDIGVGVLVAVLVLSSSWGVLRRAYAQLRQGDRA